MLALPERVKDSRQAKVAVSPFRYLAWADTSNPLTGGGTGEQISTGGIDKNDFILFFNLEL